MSNVVFNKMESTRNSRDKVIIIATILHFAITQLCLL